MSTRRYTRGLQFRSFDACPANAFRRFRSSKIEEFARLSLKLATIFAALFVAGSICIGAQRQQTSQTSQQKPPDNYTGISVEPDQALFATMCALDAAGFAADESTLSEMPSRLALREAMLKMQGPATEALRQFYHDHLLGDPGETLSRYITFSLVVGPPPRFDFQVNHDLLPPDVLAIDGFREILAL